MKHWRLLFPAMLCLCTTAWAQTKRVYIAPDDHTDYFWSALDTTYEQKFCLMLDYYLNLADSTQGNTSDFQSRWNCDGSYWMWAYERNRSAAQFQKLINRIKDGHISVPLNALVVSLGGAPTEAILRGMYYPGKIERQNNLRFRLAYAMENHTFPCGLPSLWAGSGAKYSWRGICGCDSELPAAWDREHEIYYAKGLDGSGVLLKWNSLLANSFQFPAQGMGGYAEARFPSSIIDFVTTNAGSNGFLARYPYNVIGCFGKGWDDIDTYTDEFVTTAQSATTPTRKVIVSNEIDFFQDFEATYSLALPTRSVSFGNEWDAYCLLMSETSARVKRAVEKLRAAEAMASVVCQSIPTFMSGRESARDQAWMDLGLFWEHNWGMVWPQTGSGGVTARIAWQIRLADEIDNYVNTLFGDAAGALAGLVASVPSATRFYAFNPLGWTRGDYADLAYAGPTPVHVVNVADGQEVPSQMVSIDGQQRLRIWCDAIPPVGYRVFEIQSGAGQSFGNGPTAAGGVLENAIYRVTLNGSGAIASILDKTRSNREFIQTSANDLGSASGSLSLENQGPVSVTLRGTATSPLNHSGAVTLYRSGSRIDIDDQITQNFNGEQAYSFGFNLSSPDVHHEEVGSILRAKLTTQGGHYSARSSNSRYDWLTLNHFVDMTGSDGVGITLSNADNYFMRLGNSTIGALDTTTPRIHVLAAVSPPIGSYLTNQGGETFFRRHLALSTHGEYSPLEAMKMSLEHQNPLVCRLITSTQPVLPAAQYSMLSLTNPNVLLWALKPADDGASQDLTIRLWNVSDASLSTSVSFGSTPIASAVNATHIETIESSEPVLGGQISPNFNKQQIRTIRLALGPPSGNNVPPVAQSQGVTVGFNTPKTIQLTAQDTDGPASLTYKITTDCLHGTITDLNPSTGQLTYTPAMGYSGSDGFAFKANDGLSDSPQAIVSITVSSGPPSNQAPIAQNQFVYVPHDTPLSVQLFAQDPDLGPQALTYSIVSGPSHGAVSDFNASAGTFTYTPELGFTGDDILGFIVNDGLADSHKAFAILSVLATPNVPPVARNQSVGIAHDTPQSIQLIAQDQDSGPSNLIYSLIVLPTHGTIVGFNPANGQLTYSPFSGYAGEDSFIFRANDGVDDSHDAAVFLTVLPAPVQPPPPAPDPDADLDGVADDLDLCPDTIKGGVVNSQGCADYQLDADKDGVPDAIDHCTDSPADQPVLPTGCALSQLDDDGDAILNGRDLCPGTPNGESVNTDGCSNSQLSPPDDPDESGQNIPPDDTSSTPKGVGLCGSGLIETVLPVGSLTVPLYFVSRHRRRHQSGSDSD